MSFVQHENGIQVEVEQSLIRDFQTHFKAFFKRSVTCKGEKMRVREARVFEFSQNHPNEVWVKYSLNEQDQWHKFVIEE
jgi:hypothetical protein